MKSETIKRVASFVFSLALAGGLLWIVADRLSGQGEKVEAVFREGLGYAHYYAAALLVLVSALLVRAYRWQIMLGTRGTIWIGFRSIAVGYMLHLVLSRLGELLRILNHKRYSGLPLGQLVSTTFVDRMMDVFALMVMLLASLVAGSEDIRRHFPDLLAYIPHLVAMILVGAAGMVLMLLYGRVVAAFADRLTWLPPAGRRALRGFTEKFSEGLRCMASPGKMAFLFASTVVIWSLYYFAFYLCISPFGMVQGRYTGLAPFFVFTCGTVGMAIPSPGGLGSFHYFTAKGLEVFCQVPEADAYSLTVFVFVAETWLMNIAMGVSSLAAQALFSVPFGAREENKDQRPESEGR